MRWQAITRKEIRGLWTPRGSRTGLLFVALTFVLGGYILPTAIQDPTTTDYTGYMTGVTTLLLPLLGLLLGYKTIVSERASGRMALLLSLPHSRKGAMLGKFVGRSAILAAVVGVGSLVGSALVAYPFGSFEVGVFIGYFLLTLLFGIVFLSVGMAISTLTTSNSLATAGTFGVFFLLVVIWDQLRIPLQFALDYLGWLDQGLPDWALFLHGTNPTMLYQRVLGEFFAGTEVGPYLGPDAAWYLGGWPALVLLVVWAVAPVALGYLRFQGTDL
ncbi:ABC transporter permease subunit [Haloarchaeobius sp. DFWS5]|uniref:ABC transporter permease subunit n=1 Tax=Haloarchaeobius sp. DFWS5 TaxID=3446114 RepID=UPI003EBC3C8A